MGKSDIDLAAVEGQRDDSQAAASRAIQAHEKADVKRVAQSSGMDTTYMAVAQTRRCAGEI